MRTDAFLIFPCFLETWAEVNALTITDSSSLRLRKLACHQQQPLKSILVIRMANHPLSTLTHILNLNHHYNKENPLLSHQYLSCGTYLSGHVFHLAIFNDRLFQFQHSFASPYYMHNTTIKNLWEQRSAGRSWFHTHIDQNHHLGTSQHAKKHHPLLIFLTFTSFYFSAQPPGQRTMRSLHDLPQNIDEFCFTR